MLFANVNYMHDLQVSYIEKMECIPLDSTSCLKGHKDNQNKIYLLLKFAKNKSILFVYHDCTAEEGYIPKFVYVTISDIFCWQ